MSDVMLSVNIVKQENASNLVYLKNLGRNLLGAFKLLENLLIKLEKRVLKLQHQLEQLHDFELHATD